MGHNIGATIDILPPLWHLLAGEKMYVSRVVSTPLIHFLAKDFVAEKYDNDSSIPQYMLDKNALLCVDQFWIREHVPDLHRWLLTDAKKSHWRGYVVVVFCHHF
jgi:hypothetical protein